MLWACDPSVGRFNVSHYCNPIVDQLLTEGLATTDRAARRRLYAEVQSIVLEDLPVAFLDFPKEQVALNQRVHNVFPNPLSVTANARVWWVDP
ncbi:MAG: hypothetical protein IRY97_08430 [Thermomicrobiaceae bacterium]|nr:hypothetical protein [Thermomicrobiaceae bacterium]